MLSSARRPTPSAEHVRFRILVPLVLGLMFLLAVFIAVVGWQQRQSSLHSAQRGGETVNKLVSRAEEQNTAALSGLLQAIEKDNALADAFKNRDRQALLQRARPLFEALHRQLGVTHFYFHTPDRIVFLRVHSPGLFGDKIDRQTLLMAERTGNTASGMERGATGLFTLRVVTPWRQNGNLLGYVELGIEFADMLDRLHGLLNTDFILVVNKKYLDRDQWRRAEQIETLDGSWDQFPKVVVVDKTMQEIPKPVAAFLTAGKSDRFTGIFSWGSQYFEAVTLPLVGMDQQEVGQIIVLNNSSARVAEARASMAIMSGVCLAVTAILAGCFYMYLGRIESKLAEQTASLKSEIAERQRAERHLHLQFAVSKLLAETLSMDQAMPEILRVLGEGLAWSAGRWRSIELQSQEMRCHALWAAASFKEARDFAQWSHQTVARSSSLPARVRAGDRPVFFASLEDEPGSEPSAIAKKFGLEGACVVPVKISRDLVGIIEFFCAEPIQPDDELSRVLASVGERIGQFLERLRLETRLFQTQKAETVGQLAGGVAHEFNSILTAIIGQSELLLGDLPPDPELAHKANEIRKAAERAAGLTRQLLAYGRKQTMRLELLDLNRVLAGMEGMLRNLVGQSVDVRIIPDANLWPVKADSGQIEQVLINMALNARDAMPGGGKLTLETAHVSFEAEQASRYPELKPGPYVQLAITDTGTGMDAEIKKRVFEPFFSTKGVGRGTGLGLATCYGIIKQSGGHISVYSEPGRGTTFKVYLPEVQGESLAPASAPKPSGLPRGSETILLVEDDPALNEMAAALLRRLGYTVLTAASGDEALQLVEKESRPAIDLLFTDVVVPGINGKQLADRMRELYPGLEILFTSAYTENAIVHQGVLDDGVALLQKPFTPSLLAQRIRAMLDARKA